MPNICLEPITVHIGYHKTATTFLQRCLFSDDAYFTTPWTMHDLDELIVRPVPFSFDVDATRAELSRRSTAGNGPIVVSHEDFVGHPLRGGANGPAIASRLLDLFPNIKILVVVREQTSMLTSIYKQYVSGGGALRLERFVEPLPSERRNPSFNLEQYEYHRLVSFYMKRCGAERVTVIPFELLHEDTMRFIEEVCTAIGVAHAPEVTRDVVNRGISAFAAMLKRPLNHIFIRDALNPAPLLPLDFLSRPIDSIVRRIDKHVPNEVLERVESRLKTRSAEIVGNRFAESNLCLARLAKIALADFGYPVADRPQR